MNIPQLKKQKQKQSIDYSSNNTGKSQIHWAMAERKQTKEETHYMILPT